MKRIIPLLVLILVACSAAPATALTIDILLSGGTAKICVVGTADITDAKLTSAAYRLLYTNYKMYADEFASLLEQGLEDYLRGFLGREVDVRINLIELGVEDVYRNETYYPSSITAVVGELDTVDSTYRVKARQGPGGQTVFVEIVFDNVRAYGSARLVLATALSMPVEYAEVWVYDYTTDNWDVYSVPEMNSTMKTWVELTFTSIDMLDYVRDGRMKVRVFLSTTDTTAPLELYLYTAYLVVPVAERTVFRENLCFTVEGVGEVRELGLTRYDLRIRYMSPNTTLKSQNLDIPMHLLLLNLSAFKVPLKEWEWGFNGTHTVFELHIPTIHYAYSGERFAVDPLARIVVEGFARAQDDEILAIPPTIVGIGTAIAIILLLTILLSLGKALKKQRQAILEKRTSFVRRR